MVERTTPKVKAGRNKATRNGQPGGDLSAFLEGELQPRLRAEDVFTHPSHNFHKSADKWRGGCPGHESKSGTSFYLDPRTLLWRCPACQIGGGPVQYRWLLRGGTGSPRGKDFLDVVRELCDLAGVAFPERGLSPADQERARLRDVRRALLESVITLCQSALSQAGAAAARGYLAERGFDDGAWRELEVGLYPPAALMQAQLQGLGYDAGDVESSGAVFWKMDGYLVFPWRDERGAPLTLYGRWPAKDTPDERPKTLALANPGSKSGDFLERTKRSPLYLDRALRAGHQELILVEGVIDAALLQARGDSRVIACVAAELSELQVKTLVRSRVRSVVITLDPDSAGDNGILSCIRQLRDANITPYVAPKLPDGLDPDEFLLRDGLEAWKAHVRQRCHGYRHVARSLQEKHGERQPGDDAWSDDLVRRALDFARQLPEDRADELARHFWPEIATATGSEVSALRKRLKAMSGNAGGQPAEEKEQPEAILLSFSRVKARPVEWLWQPWIPRQSLSILDGDPGLGKTTLSLDIAARVSRGLMMPPAAGTQRTCEPADVLLLGAEDSMEHTVRPRLDAAGADVGRVHALEAIRHGDDERPVVLPWDLDLAEGKIHDLAVKLVVVDPFMAFLDGQMDAHKDQDVRRCLHQLKLLAERTGAAILLIRHLNKLQGGPALYRGGGSIGITGAARSALVVGRHPTDPRYCALAPVKCNLAAPPRSLIYTHEPVGDVSRIGWVGESDLSANDILQQPSKKRKQSIAQQAAEVIAEILAGGPVEVPTLENELQQRGFSTNAIRDGRRLARIRVAKSGFGSEGPWMASLPSEETDAEPPESPFDKEPEDEEA